MKHLTILLIFVLLSTFTVAAADPVVLMYHRLSFTEISDSYTITPKAFEEDIKYLKDKGYKFCTASEFNDAVKMKNTSDLAVITFDDGYQSDYEYALPILEKYDAKATFFIIGSKINTSGYLTTQQLKELSRSDKVQIGNHFFELHDIIREKLISMYKTDVFRIKSDYDKNAKYLESITGDTIITASYPYGVYGNYFDYMLKSEGISRFCSKEGILNSTDAPFGRYTRTASTSIKTIEERISKQGL